MCVAPPPDPLRRTPLRRTPPAPDPLPPDRPKFRSFFSFSHPHFHSFFLSLGMFSCLFSSLWRLLVEFWWCFGQLGTSNVLVFAGAAGASHDSPRTPNVHISGPRRFKHHQNSTKKTKRESKLWREREKKSAKFWAPTLRGSTLPHPSGPHPSGPHPLGPHPLGPHHDTKNIGQKNGLAKIGLAKIGQIRMAKTGLAKVGPFPPPSRKNGRFWHRFFVELFFFSLFFSFFFFLLFLLRASALVHFGPETPKPQKLEPLNP